MDLTAEENEFLEFAKKHAEENGIMLNPDERIVQGIIKGLFMKEEKFGEKYCPCRRESGDKEKDKEIICPCIFHMDEIKDMDHCHCNLFVKKE